jgi:hypothetical protein
MSEAIKKVRAVPGAKTVRRGIQVEDPHIWAMFAGEVSSSCHPHPLWSHCSLSDLTGD